MAAAELAAALTSGDVSAREVTDAHLERIEAVDGAVHAFLHVAAEQARARPAASLAPVARAPASSVSLSTSPSTSPSTGSTT